MQHLYVILSNKILSSWLKVSFFIPIGLATWNYAFLVMLSSKYWHYGVLLPNLWDIPTTILLTPPLNTHLTYAGSLMYLNGMVFSWLLLSTLFGDQWFLMTTYLAFFHEEHRARDERLGNLGHHQLRSWRHFLKPNYYRCTFLQRAITHHMSLTRSCNGNCAAAVWEWDNPRGSILCPAHLHSFFWCKKPKRMEDLSKMLRWCESAHGKVSCRKTVSLKLIASSFRSMLLSIIWLVDNRTKLRSLLRWIDGCIEEAASMKIIKLHKHDTINSHSWKPTGKLSQAKNYSMLLLCFLMTVESVKKLIFAFFLVFFLKLEILNILCSSSSFFLNILF